jgi:hypothetical protein
MTYYQRNPTTLGEKIVVVLAVLFAVVVLIGFMTSYDVML